MGYTKILHLVTVLLGVAALALVQADEQICKLKLWITCFIA